MMLKGAVKQIVRAILGEQVMVRALSAYVDLRTGLSYGTSFRGRQSARQLQALQDLYRGKRCVIIGNGPSLQRMDLRPLKNEITFGLNRIYLMFDQLGFATTFLVSVNPHVIEQFGDELLSVTSQKFLSWHARQDVPRRRDVVFLRTTRRQSFSKDPSAGLWEGATVTFVALQLAFYFGFETVVLVGVDHSFTTKGPANQLVTSAGEDRDHFHPDYFGPGIRWQLPDLAKSEIAYRMARLQYERAGRRVLDATLDGELTVFPKVALDVVLAQRRRPAKS